MSYNILASKRANFVREACHQFVKRRLPELYQKYRRDAERLIEIPHNGRALGGDVDDLHAAGAVASLNNSTAPAVREARRTKPFGARSSNTR
jgi:hypothetical protein